MLLFLSAMRKQISVKTESLSTRVLSVEIYAPRWKCWVITVFLLFCLLQCNGGVPLQEPFWISCHPRRPSLFRVLFLCFVLELMTRPREPLFVRLKALANENCTADLQISDSRDSPKLHLFIRLLTEIVLCKCKIQIYSSRIIVIIHLMLYGN